MQRGFTLLETAVAAALIAIAFGALALALSTTARFTSHQAGPMREAATLLAEQTLRVAQDAWKYGSPGTVPSGSVPGVVRLAVPGSAPASVPVTLRASTSSADPGGAQISVTVQYTPDPDRRDDPGSVTLTGAISAKAPLPGTQVARPGLVPAPTVTP